MTEERKAQLRENLDRVEARVRAGCAAAGRSRDEVTLVVITKTYPAPDVALLAGLGVRDVGENRDQEAAPKHAACAGLGLTWHFVGQLQSNKAHGVVRYADLVHSVDRPSLVRALGRAARAEGRTLDCLLQVSLDGDPHRGGAPAEDVPALADTLAAEAGLRLRGLMAVAPLGIPARQAFALLPRLRERLLAAHPDAGLLSAGMSGDLEEALAEGATHLRVGSAVLGARR
ncbi:MAG TPA: YggS family pyridoxal phosphate-dependent enzyme [Kineosporiaceae bacterium]|nr:YggS family pyridoxal phosphate-dependent enzyme [Kineosporiaceae bacterium]